jgi:hypothetical protein
MKPPNLLEIMRLIARLLPYDVVVAFSVRAAPRGNEQDLLPVPPSGTIVQFAVYLTVTLTFNVN